MSFKAGLTDLISNSDQQNELWRGLLQSFVDHGGSSRHLDKLLTDARGDRALIDMLVKQAIGPIWRLVQHPISITNLETTIDFECSAREFLEQYQGLTLRAKDFIGPGGVAAYTETAPARNCQYRLAHISKRPYFRDIVEYKHRENEEWAGWRELFAFATHLRNDDWSGYRIIAPGSLMINDYESNRKERQVTHPCFPTAARFTQLSPELSWKGFRSPETDLFETDLFYLVRVYSE